MIFLQSCQALSGLLRLKIGIIALMLQIISPLVHLNQQVLHALQVRLFHIEPDLKGLTTFVDTLVLSLLKGVELAKMALFSLDLLLAELFHHLYLLLYLLFFISKLNL